MKVVRLYVPVRVMSISPTVRDTRMARGVRTARFFIPHHRHVRMSPDGVYVFNVAYDPETGEGGYSVTLRAEDVECLCPTLQRGGNASPPWTDVLQFALDSGAVCEYIPARAMATGEDVCHTLEGL